MTVRRDDHWADADVDLVLSEGDSAKAKDSPEVWMDDEVKNQIDLFAATDTSRELGGVLLGEVVLDGDTPLVRVLAAIEAKHTEAVHTSVKFTHATWDDINRVKDAKYPHMRIVGWFHTHPGFGIFLSRWDMFIQENFFNLPWQIAYVVDPVGKTSGFFRWENGKIAQIGGKVPAPEPIEVELPAEKEAVRGFPWAIVVSSALNAGLAAAVVCLMLRPAPVRVVHRTVPAKAPGLTARVPAQPSPALWEDYVVKRGDSLWAIAEARYGKGVFLEAICKLNRIDSADRLYSGTHLKLPCDELASVICGRQVTPMADDSSAARAADWRKKRWQR